MNMKELIKSAITRLIDPAYLGMTFVGTNSCKYETIKKVYLSVEDGLSVSL